MNVQLLIDSVVRQTTVLIAQLATTGGVRAPLAHVANQVFVELASELERQGLSRKLTADMFGISLRAYQRKVQRLRESRTERGRSVWEAVLGHLSERGVVARADVLAHFHRDPEPLVASILHDLVDSGLVFCSGAGLDAVYRGGCTTLETGCLPVCDGDEDCDASRPFCTEEGVCAMAGVCL